MQLSPVCSFFLQEFTTYSALGALIFIFIGQAPEDSNQAIATCNSRKSSIRSSSQCPFTQLAGGPTLPRLYCPSTPWVPHPFPEPAHAFCVGEGKGGLTMTLHASRSAAVSLRRRRTLHHLQLLPSSTLSFLRASP